MPTIHIRSLRVALGLIAISAGTFVTRSPGEVVAISGSDGTTSPSWVDIKNDGYELRAHFAAGAERLSARLDREIEMLKAKRASTKNDTKDWDFAMKEVEDSRSHLTARMNELAKATTPDAWNAAKENFGEAWQRSQLAVDKMNTTVTS